MGCCGDEISYEDKTQILKLAQQPPHPLRHLVSPQKSLQINKSPVTSSVFRVRSSGM